MLHDKIRFCIWGAYALRRPGIRSSPRQILFRHIFLRPGYCDYCFGSMDITRCFPRLKGKFSWNRARLSAGNVSILATGISM
jgi:hypothetical protein